MDENKNNQPSSQTPKPEITQPSTQPSNSQTVESVKSKGMSKQNVILVVLLAVAVTVLILTLISGLLLSSAANNSNSEQSNSTTTTTTTTVTTTSDTSSSTTTSTTSTENCNTMTFNDDRVGMTYTYSDCDWSQPQITTIAASNGLRIAHDYIGEEGSGTLVIELMQAWGTGVVPECRSTENEWRAFHTYTAAKYEHATTMNVIEEDKGDELAYHLGIEKYGEGTVNDYTLLGANQEPADYCGMFEGFLENNSSEKTHPDAAYLIDSPIIENASGNVGQAAEEIIIGVAESLWGEK